MEAPRDRVIRRPTVADTVHPPGSQAIRRLIGADTVRPDQVRRSTSRPLVRAHTTVRHEVRRSTVPRATVDHPRTVPRRLTATPARRIRRLPIGAAEAVWAAAHPRTAVRPPMGEAVVAATAVAGAVVVRVTEVGVAEAAVDRRAVATADTVSRRSHLRKGTPPPVGGVFVLLVSTVVDQQ